MPTNQTRTYRKPNFFGWIGWLLGLLVLGPVILVVVYRFVDPPITLHMVVTSHHKVERKWVPVTKISPNLIDSVIASEDSNFCAHHGFDTTAIREAWRSNQEGQRLRGASTISMQTAKNVFLWSGRSWIRKGFEAYFTVLMEALWPKRRIIEIYLNVAEWGDSVYGAEAASKAYFHTDAAHLNAWQAAKLAAALPNPEHWSPLSGGDFIIGRAARIEDRADMVRVDGQARCITGR